MYFDDHGPAHFHARHAERSVKVRIDILEVIDSDPCSLGRSCARTSSQRTGAARAGETLQPVEPLR